MKKVPGNFSHQSIGRKKHFVTGWRDFDPFHPSVVTTARSGTNEAILNSLTVNANKQLVANYNDVIASAADTLPDCDVFAMPLTNKDGTGVTFADSFVLKLQIELISATGDINNVTNKSRPFFGLGIGQSTNTQDNSNVYFTAGIWLLDFVNATSLLKHNFFNMMKKNDTEHRTVSQDDSSTVTNSHLCNQLLTDFYIGPCIGSTLRDTDTVVAMNWWGQNQTGSYEKMQQIASTKELSESNRVFDGDGQVFLYAFFGIQSAIDGSNDPAVVTSRMRYMVNANVGKDGTGAV